MIIYIGRTPPKLSEVLDINETPFVSTVDHAARLCLSEEAPASRSSTLVEIILGESEPAVQFYP